MQLSTDAHQQSRWMQVSTDAHQKSRWMEVSGDAHQQSRWMQVSTDAHQQSRWMQVNADAHQQSRWMQVSGDAHQQSRWMQALSLRTTAFNSARSLLKYAGCFLETGAPCSPVETSMSSAPVPVWSVSTCTAGECSGCFDSQVSDIQQEMLDLRVSIGLPRRSCLPCTVQHLQ